MVGTSGASGLRVTVETEATSIAVGNTLTALGITAEQAKLLGGFVVTTTAADAERATDATLATVGTDPTLATHVRAISAALSTARAEPPAADAMMLDVTMDLYLTDDVTRGLLSAAKAFDQGIEPPAMIFNGR